MFLNVKRNHVSEYLCFICLVSFLFFSFGDKFQIVWSILLSILFAAYFRLLFSQGLQQMTHLMERHLDTSVYAFADLCSSCGFYRTFWNKSTRRYSMHQACRRSKMIHRQDVVACYTLQLLLTKGFLFACRMQQANYQLSKNK